MYYEKLNLTRFYIKDKLFEITKKFKEHKFQVKILMLMY